MKTSKISVKIVTLLSFYFIVTAASYGGQTDFSGVWVLNRDKSELGQMNWADQSKVIDQKEDVLNVKRKYTNQNGEDVEQDEKYNLDGTKSENQGFGNGKKMSVSSWSEDKKSLVIKSTYEFERDGETNTFEVTETYTLSEDGNTLTIKSESQMGTRKMVYDKKEVA